MRAFSGVFKGVLVVPIESVVLPDIPLEMVLDLCEKRMKSAGGEARRLFHGRGRTLPGFEHVCIDGFPPLVVVTLFRPIDPTCEHKLLDGLVGRLSDSGMKCLLLQRRGSREVHTEVLCGELPVEPVALEKGLVYSIDPARGQNLGFFPDMRLAREWVRNRAEGLSVLNLFAFTCTFSVAARAGGAARVVNIDLSRPSLAIGRENHRRNGLSLDEIHFFGHDIFRSWNKLHRYGRYDLVILDPPTMQKGSFWVERDYAKVVRRLSKLLRESADILACLNAPHLGESFIEEVFSRELPGSVRVGRLPNPEEYVDIDEQASLKVVHYRYRRPADLSEREQVADDLVDVV